MPPLGSRSRRKPRRRWWDALQDLKTMNIKDGNKMQRSGKMERSNNPDKDTQETITYKNKANTGSSHLQKWIL